MALIINYFLESSVIFFVLFLFYHFCFAPYKNFNFNRIFLLFSAVFALIIPLMHFPLFFVGDETVSSQSFQNVIMLPEVIISDTSSKLAESSAQSWNVGQTLATIYIIGFVSFLIRLLLRLYRVKSFINNNQDKLVDKGFYYLIPTGGKISTCSFFEYLLWDETQELTSHQQQQIIEHEEAHIRNKHSYDVLIIEILCVVFWFNPVIYFYKAALTTLHEYIADHKAAEGTNVNEYIKLLSYQTLHAMKLTLGNNFFQTQIFNRMKMLKNEKRRSWWSRLSLTLPVFALLIYVFACETEKNLASNEFTLEGFSEPYSIVSLSESPERIKGMYSEKSGEFKIENTRILKLDNEDLNKLMRTVNYKIWGFYSPNDDGNLSMYAIIEKIPGYSYEEELRKPKEDSNGKKYYLSVDQIPEPKDGMESFFKYVMENLKYPQEARENNIEGKVFIEFIVNKEGDLEQAKVVKGIGTACDDEALRVINESPKWNPGLNDGEPVRVKMVLPIAFKLDGKNKTDEKPKEQNGKAKSTSDDELDEVVVVGKNK